MNTQNTKQLQKTANAVTRLPRGQNLLNLNETFIKSLEFLFLALYLYVKLGLSRPVVKSAPC